MAVPDLAVSRLKRDYTQLLTDPIDNVWAHPLEDNILEWHFALRGPEETPFAGGVYHGKLVFPSEYPLKGPAIYMLTPNGKFSTTARICVAGISDLHPEKWCPAHTVSTVLVSFLSFMTDTKSGIFSGMAFNPLKAIMAKTGQISNQQMIVQQKQLAQTSWTFNLNDKIFCKLFPHLVEEAKQRPNVQHI